MDSKKIELTVIILILIYATYVLFFKQDKLDKPDQLDKQKYSSDLNHIEQYLKHRLESVRREADFSEGFMQALSRVSHISPVSDKIKELDDKYAKLKDEEFKVLSILKRAQYY